MNLPLPCSAWLLLALALVAAPLATAEPPLSTRQPLLRAVDLNAGEAEELRLADAALVRVKLVDLQEIRDSVNHSVRGARVSVEVDGRKLVLDDRGWYYRYSHLFTIDDAIQPGARVRMGQRLGLLGKEGASGGWAHLHFGIKSRQPSGDGTPPVTVQSDGCVQALARDGFAVTEHRFARPGHYLVRVERRNERGEPAIAHLGVAIAP